MTKIFLNVSRAVVKFISSLQQFPFLLASQGEQVVLCVSQCLHNCGLPSVLRGVLPQLPAKPSWEKLH